MLVVFFLVMLPVMLAIVVVAVAVLVISVVVLLAVMRIYVVLVLAPAVVVVAEITGFPNCCGVRAASAFVVWLRAIFLADSWLSSFFLFQLNY